MRTIGVDVPPFAIYLRSVIAMVDRFPVLAGVDLTVDAGEAVLLRGENGAGKTSLLRVLAGLQTIESGDASVLGVNLRIDRRSVRRRIGFLGHQNFLYGDLTVTENLQFSLKATGGNMSNLKMALEKFGLSGRLSGVQVDRLSAGQRRRTSLALLTARDPEMWLLDEPHTGLDIEARKLLDDVLIDAIDRGRTVVFSSHEGDEDFSIPARIVHVCGGTAIEDRRVGIDVS